MSSDTSRAPVLLSLCSRLEISFSDISLLDKALTHASFSIDSAGPASNYESLEFPLTCKNGPMDSIEELLLLPGMTPEIYFGSEELEDLPLYEVLTVHGHPEGKINANTALVEVIDAVVSSQPGLPSPPSDATEVTGYVEQNGAFFSEEDLNTIGIINLGDPNAQPPVPPTLPIMFDIKSDVFRIWSDAQLDDTDVRIEIYARRDTQQTGESQRSEERRVGKECRSRWSPYH